ncbi:MAG: 1,4-alpha-glucan branching protein GlgB [Tissierellaceae bacterium]
MNYHYIENGELDAYLFHEGTYYRSYEFLGAHRVQTGVRFVLWAPNAKELYLMGDFNNWHGTSLPLRRIKNSGLWNIVVEDVKDFDSYKYRIIGREGEERIKADPYGFHAETRPHTASKYYDIKGFKWSDKEWIKSRQESYNKPVSIYEVNLMSWKKKEDGSPYSYRELADDLVRYVKSMGYTHIELMPIMEHPYDGSWGYQLTGYFAPSSRFGQPKDFMYLVNKCHNMGIGVILDWVPVHFCKDDFGLGSFDGSACFEPEDKDLAENEQWGTLNFDFSKPEVVSFLISNALYWHDYYHIDGLRIDAVAYMLYLDFGGKDLKNRLGGRENLDAIEFIKRLNTVIFENYPATMMIAEESTTWPLVTHPIDKGGLGFNYKWNMGWMNDILEYMETDPYFRKGNQNALTFSISYSFSENFILPLSHDEVVHGKKSLINKMPGSYKEKFSNLRLLYLYMYAHPGKKLLYMGGEFGQFIEWNEWEQLDWFLLDYEMHQKTKNYVKELNKFYGGEACLYSQDSSYDGFEWIEHRNHMESIIAFERISKEGERLIVVLNFTPVPRDSYPIGVSEEGSYKTLINSDHRRYGGSVKRVKSYRAEKLPQHGRDYSIRVDIPPLGGMYLKLRGD